VADRLEAIAIEGLGEITTSDDLPALIAVALAATEGVVPLRDGDVLVVTQKIVSKAEGATVDLTTVQPRPEAVRDRSRSSCGRRVVSSGWRTA
jgi:coenzyme F420-0:L-glutamate ligase/coenzyme F420-1:gamma-L-glutamate ligase